MMIGGQEWLRECALRLISDEASRAATRFPPFNSHHEGYAIIKEELDELWDEIKTKECDPTKIQKEAVQVAAMALRFLTDLCFKEAAPE